MRLLNNVGMYSLRLLGIKVKGTDELRDSMLFSAMANVRLSFVEVKVMRRLHDGPECIQNNNSTLMNGDCLDRSHPRI